VYAEEGKVSKYPLKFSSFLEIDEKVGLRQQRARINWNIGFCYCGGFSRFFLKTDTFRPLSEILDMT
jgi:hypothetical protein